MSIRNNSKLCKRSELHQINQVIHLTRAASSIRTIVLIYYHWIIDIPHNQITKYHIPHKPSARSSPRFYPYSILCLGENRARDGYILHAFLINVIPKTPNAESDLQATLKLIFFFCFTNKLISSLIIFKSIIVYFSYLIPCPGPQFTRSIHMFLDPWLRAMQSSPVAMVPPLMVTPEEDWTWIPSVLGLPLGALILMF